MPRFLIAAAHKSSGKTVISTGLAAALGTRGHSVQTFKKGPDYIDPMWLSAASGRPCYNLDFNIMDRAELATFYSTHAADGDVRLIESNKGLFDGVAVDGSDSNAALASLLAVPVVLVVDTNGMTRGIAPLLLGYLGFDHNINIAGVILNKVGGSRHEAKLRAAVETYTDISVLGAVGRNPVLEIGERHLGLTTPGETGGLGAKINAFGDVIAQSIDLDAVLAVARKAPQRPPPLVRTPRKSRANPVRIAIAQDTAFGFYYPDDLEAFADAGAELVAVDTLADRRLPNVDALFLGGGFPETQMAKLAQNTDLLADIAQAIRSGLPTYAECGGLMYLCRTLSFQGEKYPMVGAVPGDAVMYDRPQGRGYAEFETTPDHLWEVPGQTIKAHEFHYARIDNLPPDLKYGRKIRRGAGIGQAHDAIVMGNMIAGFCHLRSHSANRWVEQFVTFARSKQA